MGGSPRVNNNQSWHSLDTQVLDLPATAGLALAGGPLLWPSTGMDPSCAATERTGSMAFARRRGPLILKPMPTMAMEGTVLAMDSASGRLTQTPTPPLTTATVDTASPSWA